MLASLPGPADVASLQRDGNKRIYAARVGNTAGGGVYLSPISTSVDGGAHWTQIADRCGRTARMFVGMSAASFGHLVVQCFGRAGAILADTLLVSNDSGSTWVGPYPWANAVDEYRGTAVAVSSAGTIVRVTGTQRQSGHYVDAVIEVSTDKGRTWHRRAHLGVTPSGTTWVGFENASTGRVKVGNVLWTTTDGGQSWNKSAMCGATGC
ncbi:MAG TPA: sialidase family protein [Candidatus Eremiobacteraceae bacterium]|nr:sialidase family protein [Candidatus Eremiobacteraceae bacterium]